MGFFNPRNTKMKFTLRPYQQSAVDATMQAIKKSTASVVLELATAAGKSVILAEIASQINKLSGKKVLCLAPSNELITQNFQKYLATGSPASFYSASTGEKSTRHAAVFGTPMSVLNGIDEFRKGFACIVIDEAHGISNTVKKIVAKMKEANTNLRVIGLTATPFRTGTGYIYKVDENGNTVNPEQASKPYFDRLIFKMQTQELLDMGYLTRPVFTDHEQGYNGLSLELKNGRFDADQVKQVFEGKGRLTSKIVADVVEKHDPRFGVMFFASSINHAEEIYASLPPDNAAVVTGKTPKKERERLLTQFQKSELHYIINVSVLTVGFDSPNVGTIAILRATESAGLLLQIIGRAMRLYDGKETAMILDYAENIERHGLSNDNLNPIIEARQSKAAKRITAVCPECGYANDFGADSQAKDVPLDDNGYVLDAFGNRMLNAEGDPITGHRGQRCQRITITQIGSQRCTFRFAWKTCEDCGHHNSLTSRECVLCKGELIDPNKKLVIKDYKNKARQAETKTLDIVAMNARETKNAIKINFITTENKVIQSFIQPDSPELWKRQAALKMLNSLEVKSWQDINKATPPAKIAVRRKPSGFVDVEVLN
jgi:DNA repair protein RadD